MFKTIRLLLPVLAAAALLAETCFGVLAQNPTGSIRGTVSDEQGAVIQNASVTVTNKATGDVRRTTTGSEGIYIVENLLPGEYEVKVEAQGFSSQIKPVTVQVGSAVSVDFLLRVGNPSEVVDVVAEAAVIDRTNYKIDGVISRQKIDALPLNGRNFLQLALLEPGVTVSVSQPGQANNLFNVSVGGAPASLTRLTVDGGSILDPVTGGAAQNFSTETIQEFQISTFNFDLSTGITSVGAVNIVSRTGSNEFHGSGFFFFRDHELAAVPSLQRSTIDPSPFFRRYQYGGSFSGPIKKDKALFFVNVEPLNQDSAISVVHTGHPAFSQLNTFFTSPYDGVLLNARVDFPQFMNDKNKFFVRYSFDNNDTFSPDDLNTLPSNWRINSNNDHNAQMGLTTIFRQNLLNDLRFNFQYIANDNDIPTQKECPPSEIGCIGLGGAQVRVLGSNIMLGNSVNAPQFRRLYRYQTTDNVSWQRGSHNFRFGGEWEHDYGKGAWAFLDPALLVLHDPRVVLAVNAQIAALPLPPPVKAALTIPVPPAFTTPGARLTLEQILQLPLAVAFVGIGDPSQPPPFNVSKARQSNRYRLYWQDQWRVRPGFTFSYGFSYQYETNLLNHDLRKPNLIRPLVGKLEPSGKDKNNIAPSIGFAWDLGNRGKTVIRGGAGIYYDTVLFVTRLRERAAIGPLGNGRSQLTGAFFQNPFDFPQIPGLPPPLNQINPPRGTPLNFTSIPTKFTGANFLAVLSSQVPIIQAQLAALGNAGISGIDFFKTGTDILDPNLEVPYSLQYSIGVQRQLPNNMSVSADFVLRRRLHTLFQNDYNLFNRAPQLGGPVIPRCVGAQATDPRVACSNGPISVIQSGGREEYRALLVKLDKRFTKRYQFTASYALQDRNTFFTGENLLDWFGNRGPASPRHLFTFSGIADLPLGLQVSLIAVYSSRAPFNARVPGNIDLNGDGTTGDTLPGLKINSLNFGTSKSQLQKLVADFNAKFAGKPDARGTTIPFLVLPPNFEFGDNFQSHDIRVTKTVKLKERVSLQGFVEIFNVFNIANLGGYSTSLDFTSNPSVPPSQFNFGQPTLRAGQNFGTGGPRAFQLGARINF